MSIPVVSTAAGARAQGPRRELGSGAGGGPSPAGGERHLAWQLAMERAQCQSWFAHDAGSDAGRRRRHTELTVSAPVPAAFDRAHGTIVETPARLERSASESSQRSGSGLSETRIGGPRPFDAHGELSAADADWSRNQTLEEALAYIEAAQRGCEPATGLMTLSASEALPAAFRVFGSRPPSEGAESTDRTHSEPSQARDKQGGRAEAEAREHIRWHAEWSEQGLRLWIGTDHELPLAQLVPFLLQQMLSRCAELGTRLVTLFCNGHAVWGREQADAPLWRPADQPPTVRQRQEVP